MNDPVILGLTIALLCVALFLLSPSRIRHWLVFAFVCASFLIALIGLPAKIVFIIIAAAGLWIWAQVTQNRA